MEKAEFGKYFTNIFQDGFIMLSIGIGHDLGLFKVICEAKEPISSEEVAKKLDLKERYTREWLSTMVAAGIIKQDRDSNLYKIPKQYKDIIMTNMGFAPALFAMGIRSKAVKEAFKKDGPYGISYHDEHAVELIHWINDYRALMCEETVDKKIIPLLDQQRVASRLKSGIKVLDLGCGAGNYVTAMAQRFTKSTFIGLDYSETGIKHGNKHKQEKGLTNVTFTQGDAHNLPDEWAESFDYVFVYDVLHDLPNPHKALGQIYKVLKKDGFFSLIEIGVHSNPVENADDKGAALFYAASTFICLQSSMSEEPHIGYGACWGKENIERALLDANFKINGKSSLIEIDKKAFFLCTK